MAETYLFSPQQSTLADSQISPLIGMKAMGLLQIPELWRPPFSVLTTSVFTNWKRAGEENRALILREASCAILEVAKNFGLQWSAGIILRSSAVHESLADRGAYVSEAITADYGIDAIKIALGNVFSHFLSTEEHGSLAVIVQPLVPGPFCILGHISNERRVSITINQWMLESTATMWKGRFNSRRSALPNSLKELECRDTKKLISLFRSVGQWCTQLNKGPTHIEWAYSNATLWLLQLDFEDESPDGGVDPRILLRKVDTSSLNIFDVKPLTRVDLDKEETSWPKIDKVKQMAALREAEYPSLYYVTGNEISIALTDPKNLIASIQSISNGRVICRTDCTSLKISNLNLPRTHTVSPEEAVEFIKKTFSDLVSGGARTSEICFILHRVIPAKAAAWVLADPDSQIVKVDSLWGIPDGLQFLPHDTFEYDVKRKEISSRKIRYKVSFIQETHDGSWQEIKIARRYGRATTLAAQDVREIAFQSHQLATKLNQKIQVMWFCTIPKELGIGRNLPWFRMQAADMKVPGSRSVGPLRPRFMIRNEDDLIKASTLISDSHVLVVHPDVELIRNDAFLDKLAKVALEVQSPIELNGSVLAHAYYVLDRAGVTVIAAGEQPQYTRTRGRKVFAKLVRDEIPQLIIQHGEVPILAHIPKQEARTTLVVKLFEEAHELLNATSPDEVGSELADLLEIVRSLASATGISWEDVEAKTNAKRSQRGGFDKGIVLLETAWPKSIEKKIRSEAFISLKALASRKVLDEGIELNYATFFSKGSDNTFIGVDGTIYEACLTGFGLRILRKQADLQTQMNLPGLDR